MELFIATNDIRTPANTLCKNLVSLSITLKINMFQTKCHLSDKANHGLPVNVKSWLERKKGFTKKQKKKKKGNVHRLRQI